MHYRHLGSRKGVHGPRRRMGAVPVHGDQYHSNAAGVNIAGWILNLVLSVQVVMLDIGGMSLSSMAEHAKEKGAVANAKKADITSKFLIGLMITTLLLMAAGVLFPPSNNTPTWAKRDSSWCVW